MIEALDLRTSLEFGEVRVPAEDGGPRSLKIRTLPLIEESRVVGLGEEVIRVGALVVCSVENVRSVVDQKARGLRRELLRVEAIDEFDRCLEVNDGPVVVFESRRDGSFFEFPEELALSSFFRPVSSRRTFAV